MVVSESVVPNFFLASLAGKFDEKKFGIEGQIRTKLRRDLIRAGYFSDQAIQLYIFARIALVLVLPLVTYIFIQIFFSPINFYVILAVVAVAALIAILGPDAYIARRQRLLQQEYRIVFPDLIDMLVVCTDAGLSLDAAFARINPEVAKQSRALGMNLTFLGAENACWSEHGRCSWHICRPIEHRRGAGIRDHAASIARIGNGYWRCLARIQR